MSMYQCSNVLYASAAAAGSQMILSILKPAEVAASLCNIFQRKSHEKCLSNLLTLNQSFAYLKNYKELRELLEDLSQFHRFQT